MALRLRDVTLHLAESEELLGDKIAAILGCRREEILRWVILRKGIDARRKPAVLRVYTLAFDCLDEPEFWQRHRGQVALEQMSPPADFSFRVPARPPVVVVVGMGPAGLFCALALAEAGARVTLIERGRPVEQRLRDVRRFWEEGVFNPASNVQFGEGG
ncbi:MAG: FAD-dependent oxidoreductase, partial [Pelovirga sp.]